MTNNNSVNEFIEYAILSPYFSDRGVGINLVIVAKPESGKSYNLKPLRVAKGVMFVQDLNYASLVTNLEKIKNENIRTIVIPDMSKIFSKKVQTISQLITALNLLMEDGILRIYIGDRYPPIDFGEPVVCNIVGGVTWSSFKRIYSTIGNVEFLSRLLPISFQLSESKVEEILDNLDEEIIENIELPKERFINIDMTKDQKLYLYRVAKDLIPAIYMPLKIPKDDLPYGIRLTRSLILMSKAKAWKEGRDSVNDSDIKYVERLVKKWVGFNFEVI